MLSGKEKPFQIMITTLGTLSLAGLENDIKRTLICSRGNKWVIRAHAEGKYMCKKVHIVVFCHGALLAGSF